jgi:hypothetical protein
MADNPIRGTAINKQGVIVFVDADGNELESDGQGGFQVKAGAPKPTPMAQVQQPPITSGPQLGQPQPIRSGQDALRSVGVEPDAPAAPTAAPGADVGGPAQGPPVPAGIIDYSQYQTATALGAAFDPAITAAQDSYNKAWQALTASQAAYTQAQSRAASGADLGTGVASAQRDLDNARTVFQRASDALVQIHSQKATALGKLAESKYATPEEKARASAMADDASAQAELRRTQSQVATATAPADIAKAQADAQEASANAALTGAKVQVAQATTQAQIDAANIAVQQAAANVQATQIANKRGAAEATTAQAQAAVSPQLAQTAVDQATANVNKTLTELQDLQRQLRQAPTDEQAQQAIQTQLAQKQVELQTAQQQLDQAKQLMPIAVAQGQANVGATQANTALTQQNIAKTAQGPIFGISDQIAKYKQMIASGQIQPEEANAAIDDWLTKQVTGASTFERQQQANTFNQNQYQTQTDFNRSMAQTAGSFMNQGLGTLTSALGTMTPGHGAEYAGAVQALAGLWNQIGSRYPAPAPPQNAISSAPVVHINIGGGPPTSASMPPGGNFPGAPQAAGPVDTSGGQPPLPDHLRPATPQDVMANWQGEIQSGGIGTQAAAAGLGAAPGVGG